MVTGHYTAISNNKKMVTILHRKLQSQTKMVETLGPNPVFFLLCSPCPSQSCLSWFSHETLYTNSEGKRRHTSVPTILTETVEQKVEKIQHMKLKLMGPKTENNGNFQPE